MQPKKGSPDAAAAALRAACPRWEIPPLSDGQADAAETPPADRPSALGLVLGSGLGGLAGRIEDPAVIPYRDVPGMAASTAPGHRGEFRIGRWQGVPVIALSGRLHAYEGHDLATLTFPVQVLAAMGISHLIVSCAAGGLNPRFQVGELVAIDEHLSWLAGRMGASPRVGLQEFDVTKTAPRQSEDAPSENASSKNNPTGDNPTGVKHLGGWAVERAAPPVPLPQLSTCDPGLLQAAIGAAFEHSFVLHRGTYLAVTGPCYETRAECRMMRGLGVDLVGMSTVPELLVASELGLATLGLAVVTNMALPDAVGVADHGMVLASSERAAGSLMHVVEHVLQAIRASAL